MQIYFIITFIEKYSLVSPAGGEIGRSFLPACYGAAKNGIKRRLPFWPGFLPRAGCRSWSAHKVQETDLPIKQVLAEIDAALSGSDYNEVLRGSDNEALSGGSAAGGGRYRPAAPPRAVLVAPPGAGKSTVLPLHLLRAPWAQRGRIILLEPRRLAARAVARRMAQLLGEPVGQTIGYAMRMEKRYSAETRLLVMTEGSFTRLVLDNPELPDIAAVLFDEFHERSLEADFGLALALDAADSLRPDLRLLVMSATIDGARVAALLGQGGNPAPVITAHGRSFPVEIIYRPRGRSRAGRAEPVEEAVARACCAMLADSEGSILAFLPGQAEIKRTAALLAERLAGKNSIIAPLYGGLPAQEQEKALRPLAGQRKIVLATAIAESALTIEDVRIVIDSGLARVPVFEPVNGIMRLQTRPVSLASAAQRAGRAGRLQPGLAVRLWREEQNRALPAFTPPEILAADLRNVLLDCADFGIKNLRELRLPDYPAEAACLSARQHLQNLGALDTSGHITPLGRALRRLNLPLDPAHMLLAAAGRGREAAAKAAALAMVLTEAGLGGASSDVDERLEHFARDNSARAAAAHRLAAGLAARAQRLAAALPGVAGAHRLPGGGAAIISAGALLAATWRERVARRREEGKTPGRQSPGRSGLSAGGAQRAEYVLANGRSAFLEASSPLFGKTWLVCAELAGRAATARIKAAAELPESALQQHLTDTIRAETSTLYEPEARALRSFRQRKLGAILLDSTPLPPPHGAAANAAWLQAVRDYGLSVVPWPPAAENLRARLAFLHYHFGTPWPDVGDKALLDHLEHWLLPFLPERAQWTAADKDRLTQAFAALLPYEAQRRAEKLAPPFFVAPTGSQIAIHYQQDKAAAPVRVQEVFGLRQQPVLAGGKVPLLLELLSPAGRILQITADIAGFWAGSWREVAADMRGRYPKHCWPQNPQEASPVTYGARRKKPPA